MILVKEQEALDEIKEVGVLEVLTKVGYRAVLAGEALNTVPLQEEAIEEGDKEEDKENQPVAV
jgi:hypothetical protein